MNEIETMRGFLLLWCSSSSSPLYRHVSREHTYLDWLVTIDWLCSITISIMYICRRPSVSTRFVWYRWTEEANNKCHSTWPHVLFMQIHVIRCHKLASIDWFSFINRARDDMFNINWRLSFFAIPNWHSTYASCKGYIKYMMHFLLLCLWRLFLTFSFSSLPLSLCRILNQ